MAIRTIHDYDAPQRPMGFNFLPLPVRLVSRQCPNYRSCFPNLTESFNVRTFDKEIRKRRIAFIITVACSAFLHAFGFRFPRSLGALPFTILGILGFFFGIWNTHLIVQMHGSRRVGGKLFTRDHFDWFLWGLAAVHVFFVVWIIGGLALWLFGAREANGFFKGWFTLVAGASWWGMSDVVIFLVVFVVAWVSTWDPEEGNIGLA